MVTQYPMLALNPVLRENLPGNGGRLANPVRSWRGLVQCAVAAAATVKTGPALPRLAYV
jgi:hypothetical protein